MTPGTDRLAGRALADAIVATMVDKKAEGIAVYDVRGMATVGDWFVICCGAAPVHARAIAQAIVAELKPRGAAPAYHEGVEGGRWAVIDYADVVAHVMVPQMRDYYEIEELWREGTRLADSEFGLEPPKRRRGMTG